VEDLDTLRKMASEMAENDDLQRAEAKYCELLDTAKHLLPPADEKAAGLAYEVAHFYAHNDEMAKADEVLDELSAQFTQRWGSGHEKTVKHYSTLGKLFIIWGRHEEAVNILKRLTNGLSTCIMSSETEGQSNQQRPPQIGASRSYVQLDTPSLTSSVIFSANRNEERNASAELTVLQERLSISRAIAIDDDESADKLIIDLLDRMEVNPKRHGTDIMRARCLLIDFYSKAGLDDARKSALQTARHSAQSLCRVECKMPTNFFHISIDLAKTLINDGQAAEAEQLLEVLERRMTDSYGETHTDTISHLIRIGKMYQGLKRWEDAEPRFEQAYAACITELGYDSLITKHLERCLEKKQYSTGIALEDDSEFMPLVSL
jgi:tetratricopeptide (TPR) repeat protein